MKKYLLSFVIIMGLIAICAGCAFIKEDDFQNKQKNLGQRPIPSLKEVYKDRQNIRILTGGIKFGYSYGFFIIFGKTLNETVIEFYKNGRKRLYKRGTNNYGR